VTSPPDDGARDRLRAEATAAQRAAADPRASIWTVANAGSGKTRVLIDRVARLLLDGVAPERVLCLTYTRAAAAEMLDRLARRLGAWTLMAEDALAAETGALLGRAPGAADIARARRLFAEALDAPGGLKIQTIHAFCEAVLRRFPLEAGVAADFTVLDDLGGRALARAALETVAREDPPAFAAAARHVGDETLDALCAEVLSDGGAYGEDAETVAAAFGLSAEALARDPLEELWSAVDRAEVARVGAALATGSKSERPVGAALLEAGGAADLETALAALRDAALTKDRTKPRSLRSLPTKDTSAAHPWLAEAVEALFAAIVALDETVAAAEAARRAIDLNVFATAYRAAFAAAKTARGALDFDDLIARAAALLAGEGDGAWARYRLDGGVSHILVDEAQDTAPGQWAVIQALAAEIAAGAGAQGPGRTLFVVGDEKQSIYSFQGADLARFRQARADLSAAFGPRLRRQPLLASFRGAPAILRVVDRTFEGDAAEGVAGDGPLTHLPAGEARAGRVDLWPMLKADKTEDPGPWHAPQDAPPATHPRLLIARGLADTLADWLDAGVALPASGRALRAGDVLVLVRSRNALASELVGRLKARGVPVAGADRLSLTDQLAVKDLLALARFAVTPEDDLSLAALLRSPLFDLPLAAIEALALARSRHPPGWLWRALRESPAHAAAVDRLRDLRGAADMLRPYEFLRRALDRDEGRARLVGRLGVEAEDAIEALLAQAVAFESEAIPSLEGFLGWMARGEVSIKRQMDTADADAEGAVRVMTVHGAKGLEAPLVVLPDCGPMRAGRAAQTVRLPAGGNRPEVAAWTGRGLRCAALTEARDRAKRAAEAESRRLLYVAMTRAREWLIACGAGDPEGAPEVTPWHGLIEAGMRRAEAMAVATPEPAQTRGLGAAALRVEDPGAVSGPGPRVAAASATDAPAAPPPPPPPPATEPRLAASALGGGFAPDPAPVEDAAPTPVSPLARGVAVHALLEHLPDAAPAARAALAARLLRRFAPDADAAARQAMLAEAGAAMALPEAAALFGPDALSEVALSHQVAGLGRVAGRIDRLHVGETRVTAVDFKTDAAPPAPGAAPEPYLRQLAVYRDALRALHPGATVTMALLWTAVPRFDRLKDATLDAALARAAAAGDAS